MAEPHVLPHEAAFNAVALSLAVRHLAVQGAWSPAAWLYLAVIASSLATALPDALRPSVAAHRLRLGWYPAAMSIVFNGMRGTVGAVAGPPRDAWLLGIDERVLGTTPSVWLQAVEVPWLGEVMSAAYMLFFAYVYGSCVLRLLGPRDVADRFFAALFTLYATGFLGYSLVPALGPYVAETALYHAPIANGPLAAATLDIVLRGTNGADVFPSLHVGVTLLLLLFDRRHAPRLFRWALAPACALFAATLYLRFHYAVDVAAGAALAVACLARARRTVPGGAAADTLSLPLAETAHA